MFPRLIQWFRKYVWPLVVAASVGVAGLVAQCSDAIKSGVPTTAPGIVAPTPAPAQKAAPKHIPTPPAKFRPTQKAMVKKCYPDALNLFGKKTCWWEEKD